jgi:hypothetical protein
MPQPDGWSVLNNLGMISKLEFVDKNEEVPSFGREYANYVKRIEESIAKLANVEKLLVKFNVLYETAKEYQPFYHGLNLKLKSRMSEPHTYLEENQALIDEKHKQVMNHKMK